MSLFHRNVNQLLSNHIYDLESAGLLTGDWYWDRQKILTMSKIDSELIKDLMKLYRLHLSDKTKYEQAIIEIAKLQRLLKAVLSQKFKSEQEKKAKTLVSKFVKDIQTLISNIPIKIVVIGYIFQRFNSSKALQFISKTFDRIDKKYKHRSKQVVAQLVDLGVPALAYREAKKRGWKTAGIAPSEAKRQKCFPVDEEFIKGEKWRDESSLILRVSDVFVCISSEDIHEEICKNAENDKKEVFRLKLKPELVIIADVFPIEQSRNALVKERKQLKDFVEVPLLKACQILYDKNVQVMSTSANAKDIGRWAYININFDTLSDENKEIGRRFGEISFADNFNHLGIKYPTNNPQVTIKEIEQYFVQIALQFKHQQMSWAKRYTWEELLRTYLRITPEEAKKRGYTKKSFSNYYFDKETGLFFHSKEHAIKFKQG